MRRTLSPINRFGMILVGLVCLSSAQSGHADESLSGTYVYFQETVSITSMPVLADVVARTRAVSVQTLAQDGEWLRGKGKLCHVSMSSSSSLVTTTLPSAFRDAIPPVVTNARVRRTAEGMTFDQPPQTLVLGARLRDPVKEKLPETAADSRVKDDDKDGKPGVTVSVSGIVSGDIYLVQRSTSSLQGHSREGGFEGRIDFTNDQKILSATSKVLTHDPGAQPDPSRSHFRLQRVAPGLSCSDAVRIAHGW